MTEWFLDGESEIGRNRALWRLVGLSGALQEIGNSAIRVDTVWFPIDRGVAHNPAKLSARTERPAEDVAEHAAIELATGRWRGCRIRLKRRIVGREPSLLLLVDEAALGPLTEDEQLVIGQTQELGRN